MRKWNSIVSLLMVIVFALHAIMGSFMLNGIGSSAGKPLAWIGCVLILAHLVFGVILTVQTIRSGKASGKWYLKQNALFWTRRISGIVILIMAFFHIGLFGGMVENQYILYEFTTVKFLIQMLLIAALFTHIFVNIRPLLISLGILKYKERRVDIFLILSIVLLFCAGAVTFYYIGWQLL